MFGEFLDNAVSIFAPSLAAQRVRARSVFRQLRRGYKAAEYSRLNSNRRPLNQSADREMQRDADIARAAARDLVRNNSYAATVVDAITSNVVGRGIIAQVGASLDSAADDAGYNAALATLWDRWQRQCSTCGRFSFAEVQHICQREIVEAGECLVHFTTQRDPARGVPLALEVIEADRLASDYDVYRADKTQTYRGIEMDAAGNPVAYWIYPTHPNGTWVAPLAPIRVPASDVLHLYRRDRIGQSRGMTWFAPVLPWLRDLNTYVENELQASAVSSCFTAAITTEQGYDPSGLLATSGSDTTDSDGNSLEYLQPGMVARLRPGESITGINPGRPNSASEPWINLMLRAVAVGVGLSYETVARDYSKVNYSSYKAGELQERRQFRVWQQYLIDHLCSPVWWRFLTSAAIANLDGAPTSADLLAEPEVYGAVRWQPPGWQWNEPLKEQQAADAAIQTNLSTLEDECAAKGKDWRDVLRQRKREQEFSASLGITTAAAPQPQQEPQEVELAEA